MKENIQVKCNRCKCGLEFGICLLSHDSLNGYYRGFYRNLVPCTAVNDYELKIAKVKKCPNCGESYFDSHSRILYYNIGIVTHDGLR